MPFSRKNAFQEQTVSPLQCPRARVLIPFPRIILLSSFALNGILVMFSVNKWWSLLRKKLCFLIWLSFVIKHFTKFACLKLFLIMHFFTPFAFCFSLISSSTSTRKEYSFGLNATNSVIIAPSHSSFINPIFLLFSGTIGNPFSTAGCFGEKLFVSNHSGTSAAISAKKSSVSISSTKESVSVYRTEQFSHFFFTYPYWKSNIKSLDKSKVVIPA